MNGDKDISDVSLSQLSNEAKNLLSSLLNSTKVIKHVCPDRISRYRDWRGLASLLNISSQVEAGIKEYVDKVGKVLEIWQQSDHRATIGRLMHYLQGIDRFDIYDDLLELAKSNRLIGLDPPDCQQLARLAPEENDIITIQDAQHQRPQQYHAFVLFAPQDRDFVTTILKRLRDNGIKVCTNDDVLPGFVTRYEAPVRLVKGRCQRIILVFSPDFFSIPEIKFVQQTAQAYGVEKGILNLLPIRYRPCVLPPELTHYFCLDYPQREELREQLFWPKLVYTLLQAGPRVARLPNGSVSNPSSRVQIEELSNSCDKRPAIVAAPSAAPLERPLDSGSVASLPALPEVPDSPLPSGTVANTEPLPPYNSIGPTIIRANRQDKSSKKNTMEKLFSRVRNIGKKKKAIEVQS